MSEPIIIHETSDNEVEQLLADIIDWLLDYAMRFPDKKDTNAVSDYCRWVESLERERFDFLRDGLDQCKFTIIIKKKVL